MLFISAKKLENLTEVKYWRIFIFKNFIKLIFIMINHICKNTNNNNKIHLIKIIIKIKLFGMIISIAKLFSNKERKTFKKL